MKYLYNNLEEVFRHFQLEDWKKLHASENGITKFFYMPLIAISMPLSFVSGVFMIAMLIQLFMGMFQWNHLKFFLLFNIPSFLFIITVFLRESWLKTKEKKFINKALNVNENQFKKLVQIMQESEKSYTYDGIGIENDDYNALIISYYKDKSKMPKMLFKYLENLHNGYIQFNKHESEQKILNKFKDEESEEEKFKFM